MEIPTPPESDQPHMLVLRNGKLQWVYDPPKPPNVFKGLIGSKKSVTTAIGIVVGFLAPVFNTEIEPQQIMAILSPVMAYVLGQGIADHGKEAAKIKPQVFERPKQGE